MHNDTKAINLTSNITVKIFCNSFVLTELVMLQAYDIMLEGFKVLLDYLGSMAELLRVPQFPFSYS